MILPSLHKLNVSHTTDARRGEEDDLEDEWDPELPLIRLLEDPHLYQADRDWNLYELILVHEQKGRNDVSPMTLLKAVSHELICWITEPLPDDKKRDLIELMASLMTDEEVRRSGDYEDGDAIREKMNDMLRFAEDKYGGSRFAEQANNRFKIRDRFADEIQRPYGLEKYREAYAALSTFFNPAFEEYYSAYIEKTFGGGYWRNHGNEDNHGDRYLISSAVLVALDWRLGAQEVGKM